MAQPLTDIAPLQPLLAQRPLGLVTDVDGTISPIAPTPTAAQVSPTVRRLLSALASRLDLVAVISGRPAKDVAGMLGLAGVVYVGNHGFSRWVDEQEQFPPEVVPFLEVIDAAQKELSPLAELPGVIFEHKGATLGIHYRLSSEPEATRRAIDEAVAGSATAGKLTVHEGRMVVELRPPLPLSKGTALVSLAEDFRLKAALYLGDDYTDIDAFANLQQMRQDGKLMGAAIAVASHEAPPEVIAAADYTVNGVEGVEWLLESILAILEGH